MAKHEYKKEKKDESIDKTKKYKTTDVKRAEDKNQKGKPKRDKKKDKNKKKQRKHPKLILFLKILVVLFLLLCVIGAGVVAALFFGVFGDDFEITKEDLVISASNSKIVDQNGKVIADLSGDEKRKIITLDQMAEYLPKAYVAIEDERFYEHDGVDFKRTGGAIIGKIFGNSSYGGSTITQQLVKNITKDDEVSGIEGIMRKVKEWAKAYQVERMISKSQILELYLNILYVGGEGNLHGVELGAEYYFNKSAKDLDLAECSFLAGINSSPNYYNPYKLYSDTDTKEARDERIKTKCLTVLSKMKELGYIEKNEDYDKAVAKVEKGLTFKKSETSGGTVYSYHTDAVINQVIEQVMEEKNVGREIAENYVYGSGLTIYSTVDTKIQETMEKEFAKTSTYQRTSKATGAKTQAGMAVIDYKTGNVLGVAGELGTKKESRELRRATQSYRQTGSVMKPISVIAPGLESKVIQASTVYDDASTAFGNYKPKNYNSFHGLVSIRDFIRTSQNIPAVKIMKELTPSKSIDYLRKMGITTLYKSGESDLYNDEGLPLAIGGLSHGISPLEMAVAYGTIANGGECVTPTFYTKVEDANGNVVMTPNQTRTRAISKQNAYLTTSILQEPLKSGGTATYCAISGIDVAAKTGTTDDEKDRWLCGFTPYYAAACWYGYDKPEHVDYIGGATTNPAGDLWDSVMTSIHKGKKSARFTKPDGIVTAKVCKVSGCLAESGCKSTYTEMFTKDNMPPKCEGHGVQEICTESKKLATEYCPKTKKQNYGVTVPKEKLGLWKALTKTSGSGKIITEVCTIHTKETAEQENTNTTTTTTTTNTTTTNTTTSKPTNTTTTNTTTTNTTTSTPNTPSTPPTTNTSSPSTPATPSSNTTSSGGEDKKTDTNQ